MTMIKLSDGCYVAADCIEEVKINQYGTTITVRMKSGISHNHAPKHNQGIYDALDELVAKINAAVDHGCGGTGDE